MLFQGNWRRTDDLVSRLIETPLGAVRSALYVEGNQMGRDTANAYALNSGGCLRVWDTSTVAAELMIGELEPELPVEMRVTACHAAMWRISAKVEALVDYSIKCAFDESVSHKQGGRCSGQGLEAQEWSDGRFKVTMGTQDTWAFVMSHDAGGVMPDRWKESCFCSPEESSFVEYLANGFVIRPPRLETGETAQFHFVVAWAPEADAKDATWFAVDMSPATILSRLR